MDFRYIIAAFVGAVLLRDLYDTYRRIQDDKEYEQETESEEY
mgnify:CR=1 FL=1